MESLKIEFPHLLERIFNSFISKGCWKNRQKCKLQKVLSQETAVEHPQVVCHFSPASVSTRLCKAMLNCSLLISPHLTYKSYIKPLLSCHQPSTLAQESILWECITLGQSSPCAGDPFPQLKQSHSDLHQWGNLALNVKIHPGIQPLTNILRLEEIKYWSGPTSTGEQMSWRNPWPPLLFPSPWHWAAHFRSSETALVYERTARNSPILVFFCHVL